MGSRPILRSSTQKKHHGGTVDPTIGSSEMLRIRSKTKEEQRGFRVLGQRGERWEPNEPPPCKAFACVDCSGFIARGADLCNAPLVLLVSGRPSQRCTLGGSAWCSIKPTATS